MLRRLVATWIFVRWVIAVVVFIKVKALFGLGWALLLGLFWEVWLVVRYISPWVLAHLGL